jgi:hypothetical protein
LCFSCENFAKWYTCTSGTYHGTYVRTRVPGTSTMVCCAVVLEYHVRTRVPCHTLEDMAHTMRYVDRWQLPYQIPCMVSILEYHWNVRTYTFGTRTSWYHGGTRVHCWGCWFLYLYSIWYCHIARCVLEYVHVYPVTAFNRSVAPTTYESLACQL